MSKKFKIVAIDLGNFNVKLSNGEIFRATWSLKADKLQSYLGKSNAGKVVKTLEYDNKTYYIEKGDFDTHSEKSTKDTLPLFLYALSRLVKTKTAELKVVVGLPIREIENKDKIIKKFTGTFSFTADGTARQITVSEVRVFPECVGANFSIPDNIPMDYILTDLGGLSANNALFHDGEYASSYTIPYGILNLIDQIKDAVNSDHGTKMNTSQMYRHLETNKLWTPSSGDIDLEPYRETHFAPYVKDLMDGLEEIEGLQTPIFVIGGAAEMFKPYIERYLKQNPNRYHVTFLENGIGYNVKGFLEVGRATWR